MNATASQDAYLRSHVWGLLATGRRSGAPQLSMVAYDWDGIDIVISCRAGAAKFINARRNEHVVFAVPNDVDNLTITGRAMCHQTGHERDRLTARVRDRLADRHLWASGILDGDIAHGLDDVGRVIIQIAPDDIELLTPRG